MKKLSMALIAVMMCGAAMAQPRYDMNRLQHETLNRGVVAMKQANGKVCISWRTLASDKHGEAFDIYRDGVKLNSKVLTTGGPYL